MSTAPGTPSRLRERDDHTALETLFEHVTLLMMIPAELVFVEGITLTGVKG